MRNICAAAAIVIVLCVHSLGQVPATTQPSTSTVGASSAPLAVSAESIAQMESLFAFTPRPGSPSEMAAEVAQRMEKVLETGRQLETAHPAAGNLYQVHNLMLKAALQLLDINQDQALQERVGELSRRIVSSSAPPQEKVQADFFLTRSQVIASAASGRTEEADKQVRAFADRYQDPAARPMALAYAVLLAHGADRVELKEQFLRELEEGHQDQEGVRFLLRRFDRHPDVGKPFTAELTRLEGGKLALPQDLLGKAVVVDFWATWCPPCVAAAPKMVELYEKYHSQGVEFVGVSLDPAESKARLEEFIRQHGMRWVHAFSGLGSSDPTAQRYGVESIPSVWVIGRDGRVISDEAEGDLEGVIRKALEAPATSPPASVPVSQPGR